ncbi:MAG: leucine-rich repeat protein, partial [Eubacteriales bacterium]
VACSKSNIVEMSVPFGVLKVNQNDSLFNKNTVIEKIDFSASDGVAIYGVQYSTALKEVVFGSNMTIGDNAFKGDTALESIVFGNNITIGKNAFYGCTAIEKLDFSTSDGVTVSENAFEEASKLKDIVFGDNMTIKGSAFKNCDAITNIVVGDGLTINFSGERIFYNCDNIQSAEFGASDITFGKNSFRTFNNDTDYNSLNKVTFKDGGKYTFGERAFALCSMTEVVFPDGAEVITVADSTDSFYKCNYLTYVYLGEGTKNAAKLFYNCSGLQKAVLVGPEKIGDRCFALGTATGEDVDVLKVYIHNKDCTIGQYAFERRSGIQVYTMAPITTSNAFSNCVATTKIVDGESVSYPKYTIYYGIAHDGYTPKTFAPTCTTEGYDGFITSCPHCGEDIEPEYPTTYKVFEGVLTNSTTFTEETLAKTNIVEKIAHTAGDIVRITYANGFDKVGLYIRVCTVCANNYDAEEASAIFAALGYSIKDTSAESTSNAIYGGFTVNTTALTEYNKYTTTPLKYGIIISNVTDATNISFTDNIISGKSIQVEINDASFSRFGFTLTGFDDATAKALNIVISAYVIDENGEMSFVQRTESYSKTVTVNSVVASTLGAVTFADVEAWTKATVSE